MPSIKILGQRQNRGAWAEADRLMRTVISLRKNRPFIPKGIHRFRSFKEANQWAIRMMARQEERHKVAKWQRHIVIGKIKKANKRNGQRTK
jgi:hypothetical protein